LLVRRAQLLYAVLQLGGFGVQGVEREGFEGFGEAEGIYGAGFGGHCLVLWWGGRVDVVLG
jgi:hypothetical protein